jgi:plastocyanin
MDTEPKCAEHGKGAVIEKTEVNADGTLPWVFVYAVDGPAIGQSGYEIPMVEVDQKGCVYQPHVFGAVAGQDVIFLNTDGFSHNVHVKGKKQEWNKSQNAGQKDLYKAQKEFGVKVICDVHSWMNSWMHVLEHPFFAVSARGNGAFEIKGLYPGKYKFRAWHENWAKDKQVEFEIELKDGENSKEIEISDK